MMIPNNKLNSFSMLLLLKQSSGLIQGNSSQSRYVRVHELDIVQMVILSLIIKRIRVKALVKDKRAAMEAFGTYVEVGTITAISFQDSGQ